MASYELTELLRAAAKTAEQTTKTLKAAESFLISKTPIEFVR